MVLGYLIFIISIFSLSLAKFIGIFAIISVKICIFFTNVLSKIKILNLIIPGPNFISIFLYYLIIFLVLTNFKHKKKIIFFCILLIFISNILPLLPKNKCY